MRNNTRQIQNRTCAPAHTAVAENAQMPKITVKIANSTANQYTEHLLTLGASAWDTQP
jgi:hypothetical protein